MKMFDDTKHMTQLNIAYKDNTKQKYVLLNL